MSNLLRFIPASMEAFKRTARDVQRAYPFTLQQSQEILAKTYGYPDLHSLQEHLKHKPTPGPYPGDAEFDELFSLRIQGISRFIKESEGCFPKGRLQIEDLAVFDAPEHRKETMDFEEAVDAEINGTTQESLQTTADYVWFEDSMQTKIPGFSTGSAREGSFRLTSKGVVVMRALEWIERQIQELSPGRERDVEVARFERLMAAHPNNPYPRAMWIWGVMDTEDTPVELAQELWPQCKLCRSQFESLMPKNFRGAIEPKLVGNGAANEHYFAVLYYGAASANVLGKRREALAWARASLRMHKRDSFGARFIVEKNT